MSVVRPMLSFVFNLLVGIALLLNSSLAVAQNESDVAALDLNKAWARYSVEDSAQKPTKEFPYQHCFQRASQRYYMPLSLLLAVARGESNFSVRAVSSANAIGIMQILWPGTARHLGISRRSDLFDPCVNIDAGARYLKEMINRYDGNVHRALGAYNYGPARISVGNGKMPKGAVWYSGYIYQHLSNVLSGTDQRPSPQPLLSFSASYRAQAFVDRIKHTQPKVRLTWSKTALGNYRVDLLFRNNQELSASLALLEKAGYSPQGVN